MCVHTHTLKLRLYKKSFADAHFHKEPGFSMYEGVIAYQPHLAYYCICTNSIILCHNIYLPSLTVSGIDLKFKNQVHIFEDCTVVFLQSSNITQGHERSNVQIKNTLYRKASGSKTL